jgi:outer membrane protein OmpA-like peptidoglycan-associated protein
VQTFGIPAARLTTSGFGDTKPVAPNTAEAGRAQNRRVELVKK